MFSELLSQTSFFSLSWESHLGSAGREEESWTERRGRKFPAKEAVERTNDGKRSKLQFSLKIKPKFFLATGINLSPFFGTLQGLSPEREKNEVWEQTSLKMAVSLEEGKPPSPGANHILLEVILFSSSKGTSSGLKSILNSAREWEGMPSFWLRTALVGHSE